MFSKTVSLRNCLLLLELQTTIQYRQLNVTSRNLTYPNMLRGIDYIRDPKLNKGLGFSLKERQVLGIQGLIAPNYKSLKEQVDICRVSIERLHNNLDKYIYLVELQDTNELLFFSLIASDLEKYLTLIGSPTVGLACQNFGFVYRRPRGMFIPITDRGHVLRLLQNWPDDDVKAICVTDGERVLGLGDLGVNGMGIPIGKLLLYTALAGVPPYQCLPITLDVGTNNQKLLEDPLYIGLRQKRVSGKEYEEFVDEFMEACTKRFGSNILVMFEDFALNNATALLQRYQKSYCTFNDDIQGTASAAVAGLLASERITKQKLSDYTYMFFGAGSACAGIASLIVAAMLENGISREAALKRIYMFDVNGFLTTKRKGGVPGHATEFGKDDEPMTNFEECVAKYKPTCLIGGSTVGGAFNEKILKMMATHAERPVIFALSNPVSKAECTPEEAYNHTEGRCIFAGGSPLAPIKYKDKEYHPGYGNNAYIFPALAFALMSVQARIVPPLMFLKAARAVANSISDEDLSIGRIFPPVSNIRNVSNNVAIAVCQMAYDEGIATLHPQPKDFNEFLKERIYNLEYDCSIPQTYDYCKTPDIIVKSVEEAYKDILCESKSKK